MSRTDCSFSQLNDKNKSFKASLVHMRVQLACKQALLAADTHIHILLSMIDGKRHKGQQSAGLHLDRTRILLHHLDLEDGADPNGSFPQSLHYNVQYRSATVLKGYSSSWPPVSPLLSAMSCEVTTRMLLTFSIWIKSTRLRTSLFYTHLHTTLYNSICFLARRI